ncbi:MAG: Phosphopantetheine adenylyltransferase [Bacteroidetes bacterium ADurb.BinA261]|jgi:pantetheine-phosphate adenylyltransferase|nr:pantetheine-phosphate adenylyltransferase [Dysgonamonadaceae bacterium]MBP9031550.1 pantetheine-phosphate adenylyltransferase [Dysgonamonadaceae bacterium]OPZ15451.1 MAG: Phosphopantetheine adenylyltransferase [Bacteroidetes bacterium ADurb.BinA261]HOV35840.1 pantetheine-phosphate adenylyltransferase [Dysgonamonadaceae bacterium]HQG08228.1 pantetheine-phosphate adenylyltransferase [Dysgonamonadaceae bacterium]
MDDSHQASFYPGNVSDNADKRIALFPGTFDPFTIGHESLVQRALGLVDEIVIAIGVNESKKTYFSLEQRLDMIGNLYQNEPRVKVGYYDCLTIDFAKKTGAKYILRGIRSVNDFEYEKTIADMNRALSGIETFVLFTEPALTHVSSTQVRELLRYGHDVSDFVPKGMKIKM